MSKPKTKAVAPVKLVCAACQAPAPEGTKDKKHKNCPRKEIRTPLYVEAASAIPTDITRFIPQKATAGAKVGADASVEIKLEEKKTAALEATSGEALWVQPYYWNGNTWLKVGEPCHPNKERKLHGEDNAWRNVEGHKASWIAFVQSSPPCDDKCFERFLNLSRTCAGFVFFVTGGLGGYADAYKKLTQDASLTAPFVL